MLRCDSAASARRTTFHSKATADGVSELVGRAGEGQIEGALTAQERPGGERQGVFKEL